MIKISVLTNLFLIAIILVHLIDISGFKEELEGIIAKILKTKGRVVIPKPFSCSYCMNFWISLIYLNLNINLYYLFFVLLFSFLSPVILNIFLKIRDFLLKITC